jgi:hypothetical protein
MYCVFGQDIDGEQVPLVRGSEKECDEQAEKRAQEVEREKQMKFERLITVKEN